MQRTRFLTPDKLLSLLESRGSELLSGGSKDLPARHQTLRAAIEWSHEMLTPSEQALLRRLAVFQGGFTLEDAAAVCPLSGGRDILPDLESLVENNLVHQAGQDGEPWYIMLVIIHDFAEKRLEESGEAPATRLLHARRYLEMAERAEPDLDRLPGVAWTRKLSAEYSNIRAAVEWSTESLVEIALRITSALERFCDTQGHWRDAHDWLVRALSRTASPTGLHWRAKAFAVLCNTILGPRLADESASAAEQSVALWREIGDARGPAHALLRLGIVRSYRARTPEEVLPLLNESALLQHEIGDGMGLSHTMFWQAHFTYLNGDVEKARAIAQEDQELARREGDISRAAAVPGLLGLIAADEGDYASSQSFIEESLMLYRKTADLVGIFYMLCSTGGIAFLRGNYEQARAAFGEARQGIYIYSDYSQPLDRLSQGLIALQEGHLPESLFLFREGVHLLRDANYLWARQCRCACLVGIAGVQEREGHPTYAARILGSVESVLQAPYFRLAWGHNFSLTPTFIRLEFERLSSLVRSALADGGGEAFAAGRRIPLEQTVAEALTDAASG